MEDDCEERKQLREEIEKCKKELAKIEIPIRDEDLIYKVNLGLDKFTTIFHRVDKIFQGNYLQFIRKVQNPYLKEIYVLLRKYQYFFTELVLNDTTIFDFTESSDTLLDSLIDYLSETNVITIGIKITPRFKRNEIDFNIEDDIFNCKFSITFNYFNDTINFLEYHKVSTEISGISVEKPVYPILMDCVSNSLKSFMLSYHGNIFQGINKFLVYFENYFPEIYKEANGIRKSKKDIWTQEEQNRFEEGYVKYRDIKSSKEKFAKLAEYISTKSLSECIKRYKLLREISIKDNVEGSEKAKNSKRDSRKKEEKKKESSAKENNIKVSKDSKDNRQPGKAKKQEVAEDSKPVEIFPENTFDLVDEILNQFNTLYSDIKLETPEKKEVYTLKDQYDSEDFEEAEDDEEGEDQDYYNEEENNHQNRAHDDANEEIEEDNEEEEGDDIIPVKESEFDKINRQLAESIFKKKNNESKPENDKIVSNGKSNIDPVYDNMIRNVVRNGMKQSIRVRDIKLENISLAIISSVKFFVKCGVCKQTGFQTNFIRINNKLHVYYCGTRCTKCKNDIYIVFKADYIHINNTNAGSIFYVNSEVIDILETSYEISCSNCTADHLQKVKRVGGSGQCSFCKKVNLFGYGTQELISSYGSTKFLDDLVISYFQKYTINEEAIEDNFNYIKKYDKIGLVGNPLPEKGTCKHFKESFRWFRFSCCLKRYACPQCHDEVSDHASETAKLVLCGFCSFEQNSLNTVCSKCGNSFTKDFNGKGFWEGGKGCRDQQNMNSKDKHKFTGVAKTISNKAKDKKPGTK
jgi:uncharacterized CHY-type Zn-finger protein